MKERTLILLCMAAVSLVHILARTTLDKVPSKIEGALLISEFVFLGTLFLWFVYKIGKRLFTSIKRIKNDQATKGEKQIWIVGLIIVSLMVIIYWSAIRPSGIKQNCHNKATEIGKMGSKYYETAYKFCLNSKGL